jgi:hypothetical protein
MLQTSSKSKKKTYFRSNSRVVQNTPNSPKVSLGFSPPPKQKTIAKRWPPLNNEKEFPSLETKDNSRYIPLRKNKKVQKVLQQPLVLAKDDSRYIPLRKNKKVLQQPLVLSPIDQVLGCWAFDSNLPPPEVLIENKKKGFEQKVQFESESDSCEITLNQFLKITKSVHKNQSDILNILVQFKTKQIKIPSEFLLTSLLDFANESKRLASLCKHVR